MKNIKDSLQSGQKIKIFPLKADNIEVIEEYKTGNPDQVGSDTDATQMQN